MPLGFLVRLGNGQLGAGDIITGERTGFNTQTSLGTGSWTWSGTNATGGAVTNQTANGSYFLATDGSVYFVPNSTNVGTISTASATTAPAFDDRTFGTTAANTIQGDGTFEVIYGGTGTGTTNTGADTINAGSGNDQIFSGDGNDRVTGGGHDDTIQAGTGDDTVYGDNATNPTTGTETLNWIGQGASGTNVAAGFTQDTGGMRVTVDFEQTGTGTAAATSNATQFVGTQGFAANSSLQLTGNTGTNTTTSIVFDPEAGSNLSNEVSNVAFRLNDIDTQNWIDQITIRAWNAQGQLVSVTLTASGNDIVNSANGTITSGAGQDDPNLANGSVLVNIAGPVHHIEIVYTNGGTTNQFVWMTNMTFSTLVPTDGNDVIDAGDGNDLVYGGGANDSITGGADQDTVYGGDGNDTLNGGTGNDSIFGDGGNDTLNGEDGADTLFGGEGNDSMTGGAGSDTLDGGNGADTMSDVSGANTFYGSAGNDTISGGSDADIVFGGADDDSILGNDGADVLNGEGGNDRIAGGNGADSVSGGDGNDTVQGDAGSDTLVGGAGNDSVYGGLDNDRILFADADGTDLIQGGEGAGNDNDTLVLSSATSTLGATVIASGFEQGTVDYDGTTAFANFSEIEIIEGTAFADTINLALDTSGMEVYSGAGNDVLTGGSGDDTLRSGDGDDSVVGGAGADTVDLGAGNDRFGTYGNDSAGNDTVIGGEGDDSIIGGGGNDILSGDAGNDTLSGGVGNDSLFGGDGADTFVITDDHEADNILGGEGGTDQDTINFSNFLTTSGVAVNVSSAEAGNYGYFATPGGYANAAGLFGQIEAFNLTNFADQLNAASAGASVTVWGNGGNDTLIGSSAADTLFGGDGADTITGGAGADSLAGGADADTFVVGAGFGADTVDGGEAVTTGIDRDAIDASTLTTNVTITASGFEAGSLTDGTSTLTYIGIEEFRTGSGNDTVVLSVGNETIFAGAGNDSIFGGAGSDSINGGDGADRIGVDSTHGLDTIAGGEGLNDADTLAFTASGASGVTVTFTGAEAGNYGFPGAASGTFSQFEAVEGTALADTLNATNAGASVTLSGGAGNDTISGSSAADTLAGGDGADLMTGGAGADVQTGGAGDDTFVLGNGFGGDTITGGETLEGAGDTVDASAVTTGITLDLSTIGPGNPEDGTLTTGGNTATFSEIERVILGSGADSIIGSAGVDTVLGGAGADRFDGGAGNDVFDLGADSDSDVVVLDDGDGQDRILNFAAPILNPDGSYTGRDLLDVSDLLDAQGNPVNIWDAVVSNDGFGNAVITFPGGESVTLVGVAPAAVTDPLALIALGIPPSDGTVTGTVGGDLINTGFAGDPDGDRVDSSDNILAGRGPNDDVIRAGGGGDTVYAGAGNDDVAGEGGDDTLDGGAGNDTLSGGAGSDILVGGAGDDIMFGGDGADRFAIAGGHGTDTIAGGEGPTDFDTLGFSNFVNGTGVTVTFTGNESGGYDFGPGQASGTFSQIEAVEGTTYADTLDASAASTSAALYGDGGNDTLTGGAGADTLDGGSGDDVLGGGIGADSIDGGTGNDTISIAQGDVAQGGVGDDLFVLQDLLEAGSGTLTVVGGSNGTPGDTLQLGTLAQWNTLNITSTGPNGQSGTILLDDGTLLTFSEIENIICFTPGARIATPQGARAVETLAVGDMVVTRDHGLQPIRWIGRRTVPAQGAFAPIRIRPGVVTGQERDLIVSPQHRMLFQGYRAELLFGETEVLVAATHLVDGRDVVREEGGDVTYIHILFDAHEIIFAEGAATESFHPGEVGLSAVTAQARAELLALFPDLATLPGSYGRAARRSLKRHEALLIRR